jgi:AhpD family alkylhydroperoxidase
MALLQDIEWEAPIVAPRPDRRAELAMLRRLGFVPPAIRYFTACPWMVRATVTFDVVQIGLVYTDFEFADVVSLVVSQDNSCRFCYAASRAAMRIMGHSEERIRRLEQNLLADELSKRERLALDYARRLSRANPIPSRREEEQLRDAGFEVDAIKEIAFLAAVNVFLNRVSTLPAVPTEGMEQVAERGLTKLFRPLIARYLRSRRRRGRPARLTEEERRGPFAEAVAALDGLPAARALRRVLNDAWQSRLLPRSTKALITAVVARGLGCAASEHSARAMLLDEGWDDAAVEPVLSHLSSPRLDAGEAAILRVARETIWYRTAELQRHARQLRALLSEGEFLEFAGTAALANMVCRLSRTEAGEGR